jgi:hypothetical protein
MNQFIMNQTISTVKIESVLLIVPYLKKNIHLDIIVDVLSLSIDKSSNANNISQEFSDDCVTVLQRSETEETVTKGYTLSEKVTKIWKEMVIYGINESNVEEFKSKSQKLFYSSNDGTFNDSKSLFNAALSLESIDENIWDSILLNPQLWSQFKDVKKHLLNFQKHLVPHSITLQQSKKLFENYAGFLDYSLLSLEHLSVEKIFKDLSNSWLILELLQAESFEYIFTSKITSKIEKTNEKIFKILVESDKWMEFISYLISQDSFEATKLFFEKLSKNQSFIKKHASEILKTILKFDLNETLKSDGKATNVQHSMVSLVSMEVDKDLENLISSFVALSSSVNNDSLSLIINNKFNEKDEVKLLNNLKLFTSSLTFCERHNQDKSISIETFVNSFIELNEMTLNLSIHQQVSNLFTRLLTSFSGKNFSIFSWNKLEYLVQFIQTYFDKNLDFLTSNQEKNIHQVSMVLDTIQNIIHFIQLLFNKDSKYEIELNTYLMDAMISINRFHSDLVSSKFHQGNIRPLLFVTNDLLTSISNTILPLKFDVDKYFSKFCVLMKNSKNIEAQIATFNLLNTFETKLLDDKKYSSKIWSLIEESPLTNLELKVKSLHDINDSLKDANLLFGYLLSWWNILEFYVSKKDIYDIIKDKQYFLTLLNVLTSFILKQDEKGGEIEMIEVQNITKLNMKYLEKDMDFISLFCSQFMFQIVKSFPSLVRLWFNQIPDKRISENIEKFIVKNISPHIISYELDKIIIKSTSLSEEVSIKVTAPLRQIVAIYEQDEVKLDISLTLPTSYPLKGLIIHSSKKLGVDEGMYRKWILKMTTVRRIHFIETFRFCFHQKLLFGTLSFCGNQIWINILMGLNHVQFVILLFTLVIKVYQKLLANNARTNIILNAW